jgi:hypothetical protein
VPVVQLIAMPRRSTTFPAPDKRAARPTFRQR